MYSRKHYLEVLKEAEEKLALTELESCARICGFQLKETERGVEIIFDHYGKEYRIKERGKRIESVDGREMPLIMRVIALHHLIEAKPAPITGGLAPIRSFPGLESYEATIRRRTEELLSRAFGNAPERLAAVARKLGGAAVGMGDAAARVYPLPRLPIVIVINKAGGGLPAAAGLLYDRSAPELLPLEDLVALAELVSRKIVNIANQSK
jgi:hypothetical protein